MWYAPCVYVSFCGDEWSILGRISDASDDVCDDAEVVHSARIVVWYAMQALARCQLRGSWGLLSFSDGEREGG